MARLKDVTPTRSKPAKTQLYVDLDLAKLIRRVASAEQRELSPLIEDMFVLYLRTTHPDWELDFTSEPPDSKPAKPVPTSYRSGQAAPEISRRTTGQRRGRGHESTGKPVPGADQPGITRRKATKDRRTKKK
jgi:hypothetical protein